MSQPIAGYGLVFTEDQFDSLFTKIQSQHHHTPIRNITEAIHFIGDEDDWHIIDNTSNQTSVGHYMPVKKLAYSLTIPTKEFENGKYLIYLPYGIYFSPFQPGFTDEYDVHADITAKIGQYLEPDYSIKDNFSLILFTNETN